MSLPPFAAAMSTLFPPDRRFPGPGSGASRGILLIYLVGVWLAAHWYLGVAHDGVFYAAQAVARLSPEHFRHDLFFAYGSQGDFTLFTPLYAWLATHLEFTEAAMLLVAIAHVAWFAGVVLVARHALGPSAMWPALVLICGATGLYGPDRTLSYGEGFATGRVWAEAISIWSVLAAVRGRRLAAFALAALSLAMHPIMGLGGLLFVGLWLLDRRRLAFVVAAGIVSAGIAGIMLDPALASRAFAVMDEAWYRMVLDRAPYVLITEWKSADLNEAACLLAVLAAAAGTMRGDMRRICLVALGVGGTGLGLALAASLTQHALLVQLQPWRVLWLIRIIAALAVVELLRELWPRDKAYRLLMAWLAIGWLATPYGGGAMALVAAGGILYMRNRPAPADSRLVGFATWAALALVAGYALLAQVQFAMLEMTRNRAGALPENLATWNAYTLINAFGVGCFLVFLFLLHRLAGNSGVRQGVALVLATAFAAFAALHWDQRPLHEKDLYASAWRKNDPLAAFLPKTALVYWEDGHVYAWAFLQQGNYASRQQATGSLFSRETALESRRRLARLARLGVSDSAVAWRSSGRTAIKPAGDSSERISGLIHVCHDPILDYVILGTHLGRGVIASFPWPWGGARHVYDCARLRRMHPDPFAG